MPIDLVVVAGCCERKKVEGVVDAGGVERAWFGVGVGVISVELGEVEAAGFLDGGFCVGAFGLGGLGCFFFF